MKRTVILLLCLACAFPALASHIIGGEMFYVFKGKSGNSYTYEVTLKLFRICESGQQIAELPSAVHLVLFNNDNGARVNDVLTSRSSKEQRELPQVDPCIVNPPRVCFQIGVYTTTFTVPENSKGYTVAFQSCCRDNSMQNIVDTRRPNDEDNFPGNGATYFTELPGTSTGQPGNTSPVSAKDEAVLVCAGKKFVYDFSARDADGDRLEYEFCDAFGGGKVTNGQNGNTIPPTTENPPPYPNLPYKNPYSGTSPLGDKATIDPNTGIISGIAPPAGKYVVTVCVKEYRGEKMIGIHRKDFHINVTTCVKVVEAATPDKYADCTSNTITFINNSTPGKSYYWDFGDGTSLSTNSTDPIQHTYANNGTYQAKLYVDKNSNCGDSALTTVYVYPVLNPGFTVDGLCSNALTSFINNSNTTGRSDRIIDYRWDFGDSATLDDTSHAMNPPKYKYPGPGTYTIQLRVQTLMGCDRTITKEITVYDKPPVYSTGDTLLCIRNSLQLEAYSTVSGTYKWAPDYNLSNAAIANPVASPKQDVTYEVTFTDGTGCTNTKKVQVDVRDTVIVRTSADSTVCTGDEINLHAVADGDYPFTWYFLGNNTEVGTGPDLRITPPAPRAAYAVQADLGDCSSRDTIQLKVVDPPKAYAGADTTICHGDQITLRASGGSYYQWAPVFSLTTPRQATTQAKPKTTTNFIVTVRDTLGCPKPVTDTVLVTVIPPVPAFAGNDTIAIRDQPFQLHATGGVRYVWTPSEGLDNPAIADPYTTVNRDFTYTVTAYTKEGCWATDDINIRFIKGPGIYIPTGFSPNGDGRNDIFRPLPVGIVQLDFFRVFDRWGKLMYATNEYMKGWDGTVNGQPSAVGTYVWVVQGKDVNGQVLLQKGTVTLIR